MISSSDILNAKVLIVDDQEGDVLVLERLLHGAGYASIESTTDPRQVCELHRQNNFDLILLDLQMPDLDGFQVMEELKKIETDNYLPVLVLTAEPAHKLRALKAGAKDFVSKPFDLAEVLSRVYNMLEVRLLQTETRSLYKQVVSEQLALVRAKDEISRHAVQLEQVLSERTVQLRETVGELEAFSYSVSHDMRAPLRAMQGYAALLVNDYGNQLDEQGLNHLRQIMRSAVRLDSLIRDVLSYTKILQPRLPMNRVDLDSLVTDVVETFTAGVPLAPRIQINRPLPAVWGNETLLTQCISNFVGNGIKFVAPGTAPRLEIGAEERESSVIRIWCKDNGLGIAPADRKRIFKIFEQINPGTEYEGTGIGLSIVRKAVERMHAEVGLESVLGQGSCFWIDLKKG